MAILNIVLNNNCFCVPYVICKLNGIIINKNNMYIYVYNNNNKIPVSYALQLILKRLRYDIKTNIVYDYTNVYKCIDNLKKTAIKFIKENQKARIIQKCWKRYNNTICRRIKRLKI